MLTGISNSICLIHILLPILSSMEPSPPSASTTGTSPAVDELHEYISRLDFYRDLRETEQSIKRNIEYDDVA